LALPESNQPRQPVQLSTENLQTNSTWGDTLQLEKPANTFRLYGINPNGLRMDKQGGDISEFFAVASSLQVDLIGAPEHNLDFTQFRVQNGAHQAIRHTVEHSKTVWSHTPTKFESMYKPGGTMSSVVGNTVARIKETGTDDLGRWSYIKLSGKDNKVITFITVYQVCKKPPAAVQRDSCTAHSQQQSLLTQQNRKDPSPIKHFRADLNKFLKTCHTNKELLVLFGDFNEVLGSDSAGISKMARDYLLIDVMHQTHAIADPATYARGKTRIDYVLASQEVFNSINECGYEPFNEHFLSDHRGYFVDFDLHKLFGNELQRLASLPFRDVRGKDTTSVTQYIEAKDEYLEDHNFFTRIAKLQQLVTPDEDLAEQLDRDWERASLTAGKKTRKARKSWWSTKLAKAKQETNLYRTLLSMLRQRRDYSTQLTKLRNTCPTIELPDSIRKCSQALRDARSNERDIIKDSFQHREDEILQNIENCNMQDDKSKGDILRNIRKAEEIKQLFNKLKFIRGKYQQSGISSLEVPSVDGDNPKKCKDWKTVDTPKEIVAYLLARNQGHFGQAEGPLTIPPMSEAIDYPASTAACDLMLEGEFNATELEDLTQLLVKNFSKRQAIDCLPYEITKTEFLEALQVWKEGTSTSPSDINLGHYHALFRRHKYKEDSPEAKAFDTKRERLIQAQLTLLNYSLKFSHSYKRWRTIVNVMILKEPGNTKIHRLRVIHIYEADYNLLLGVKWRQLLHRAEDKGLINDGCYGSRPGREARTVVFMEIMQMEISRGSRKPFIKFDNDATSCYDRIIPGTAMLISRKYGLHRNVAAVCGKTLAEAHYKVKTMLGVSEEGYSHCEAHPIYGTGQGSRNSPTCWLLICSTLFDCFETQAYGASYESVDGDTTIRLFMAGFVDDNAGQVNLFGDNVPPLPETLLAMMQHDGQLWADILRESGGDLELPKCSYHFIFYDFLQSGTPIHKSGRVGPELKLRDGNGNSVAIQWKSNFTSHKTLGCHIEPRGNQEGTKEHLRNKMNEFHRVLVSSALNRREAWTFYFAIYLPSIGYPLPLCHFSKEELDTLHKKVMGEMIARCGYNRKTKWQIIYGPASLAGACFRHPYGEQGTGQILFFLKYWRSHGHAGSLARIALSWAQFQAGIGTSILIDTSTPLPHLETCWLSSLRTFLACCNGTIEVDNPYILPLQREHDFYLMDAIIASKQFTPKELCKINYCRLYLQVLTLSDISIAGGARLDPYFLKGTRGPMSSTTKLHHVNQARPNARSWNLWQRANYLWTSWGTKLKQPLGRWLVPSDQLRLSWKAYFDPHTDELLIRHTETHYNIHRRRSNGFRLQPDGHTNELPPLCRPASVLKGPQAWATRTTTPIIPTLELHSRSEGTFDAFIETLPDWEQQLLSHIDFHSDLYSIHHCLVSNQTSMGVSDGSVVKDMGAYGWCLSSEDGTRLATGMGPANGMKPSSYRAEGYGMLSILRFIIRLFEYCGTEPRCSQLYSDNMALILRIDKQLARNKWYPNDTISSDWDVLQAIVNTLRLFDQTPFVSHVKGHQDDTTTYALLPLEAQLNVDADSAATLFQADHGATRYLVPIIAGNSAQLNIDNKTVTYSYVRTIRNAYAHPLLRSYIGQRNKWTEADLLTIDWTSLGSACNRHHAQRHFVVKLSHDLLPTRKRTKRYDPESPSHCIYCNDNVEDRDHLMRCQHETCETWRNDLLRTIRTRGDKLQTDPVLLSILIENLHSWLHHTPPTLPTAYPAAYRRLVREQTTLGWRQLFNGRWSTEWSRLQDRYLSRYHDPIPEPLCGPMWTSTHIDILWTSFRKLWDSRNGKVHGVDTSTRAAARKDKTHRELRALYSLRADMRHCDRDVFHPTVEDHIEAQPVWAIQNWLRIQVPMAKHSVKEAARSAVRHVRTIVSYFGVAPPPDT
jgi:hypothetical protein